VSCAAPTSSTKCPGNPRWISAKATNGTPGFPEGATVTVVNGTETTEFTVTTDCSCNRVFHGIVNVGDYRLLDDAYCAA
jgi:hypothetical protein